ncbi:MAG: hypothetical protein ACREEM_09380 [Blastocatellia bacterium]
MVNPEITELRQKQSEMQEKQERQAERIARIEGRVSDNNKQTIWQFAIFMIGMATLVFAILNYQTNVIEKRFDDTNKRIESLERNQNSRMDTLERRMDRIEKSLDDLNKELRARQK